MIRMIASSLLVAGLFAPVCPAQPDDQVTFSPDAFVWGEASRSYLGVDIQDVNADRVAALKLKEERGVEVTMVDQDAPAGKAGIKEHDVILDFNGARVESEEQLRRLIRETPPGRSVTLGISRDGSPMRINVQLGDRGKTATDAMPKVIPIPRVQDIPKIEIPGFAVQVRTYSPILGIQAESLGQQLAEYFGVKEGVLVSSVEKGSAAEKAGLKAGDVIVRANNEKLTDRADLSRILRNHREGGKITLGIVREKREQTITVELPARGNPHDSLWRGPTSDDLKADWVDIENDFQDMSDELVRALEPLQHMSSADWKSVIDRAKLNTQASKPALDRAMRQAQSEWRRAQKMLEQQKRELHYRLHDMI